MSTEQLVSVLTPVYNGEAYLAECIESVLNQTYSNWQYIILNNCSTDGTARIARRYEKADNRVRVCENESLLDIIANHNKAFSLISPETKYCKIVSGDDWLFPECLARMVAVAEGSPSVGLVGSYQLSGGGNDRRNWRVRWGELSYPSTVTTGREICRSHLLGEPYVFGTPTSLLYRADLVRRQPLFYPNSTAEADTSACYQALKDSDFGFVHQVLSYERIHEAATSATCRRLNSYVSSWLSDLVVYGPNFLTPAEIEKRRVALLREYYIFLAASIFSRQAKGFWSYHKKRLAECGAPMSRMRLATAVASKAADLGLNPKQTFGKLFRRFAN